MGCQVVRRWFRKQSGRGKLLIWWRTSVSLSCLLKNSRRWETVAMMTSNEVCSKLLIEARTYHENQGKQSQLQSIRTQTRSGELHVILFHDNKIPCIDTTTGEVKIDLSDPTFLGYQATSNEMRVVGNFLYILSIQNFCRCHLLVNRWYILSPRKRSHCYNHSIVALNDAVFAIGGRDRDTQQILSLVERYSIQDDSWTECCPSPVAIHVHSGVVCDGRIFISGGVENAPDATSTVLSYDPIADTWRREPSLNSARLYHSMFEFKGRIYVTGGIKSDTLDRGGPILALTRPVETIEMFTPSAESSGTWTVCKTEINLFKAFTVVEKEEVYFLIGSTFPCQIHNLYHMHHTLGNDYFQTLSTMLFTPKRFNVIVFSPKDDGLKPYNSSSLKFPVNALLQWNSPRGCCKFTFPRGHIFTVHNTNGP